MGSWNQAILRGEATVERPPADLVFIPVKQRAKKRTPSPPPPAQPPAIPTLFPWQLPVQYLPPPPPPVYSPPLPAPPPPPPAIMIPMSAPTPNTEPITLSSPLGSSDTDPMNILRDYIEWTARRMSSAQEELEKVLEKLENAFHDLVDLETFTDQDWERLDAPLGLGRRLARDVGKYRRERKKRA